ncbi:MAG TPA: hypothetical protein VGL93_03010 [Streptosporangiaceae bacterium]|jgi:AcrR family transcriptional regulator
MAQRARGRTAKLGRPRRVEDEAVFAAMASVLLRTGWARMTVQAVAAEVGVTPAALRQRFGARKDMFTAFYAWHTELLKEAAAEPPADDGPVVEVLAAQARASVAGIESPEQMRNAMSPFTEVELTPGLLRMAGERFAAAADQTAALLDAAQRRGEIAGADPADLALRLRDCLMGASLAWSMTGGRPIGDVMAETVERMLAPYLRRGDQQK